MNIQPLRGKTPELLSWLVILILIGQGNTFEIRTSRADAHSKDLLPSGKNLELKDKDAIEKTYYHWIKTSDKDFVTMMHLFHAKDFHCPYLSDTL